MSAVDEREAIGVMFETGWANRLPVAWPNAGFDPNPTQAYSKFSIVRSEGEQIEIGGINNQRRATGRVFLQVFVPLGTGDKVARGHCDFAAGIFKANKSLTTLDGRVLFREPVIRDIGGNGPHHQINVSIPYLYDTL